MNLDRKSLYEGLKNTTNLQVAYDYFDEPPNLPFIAYVEAKKDRFIADNKVYFKNRVFRIELYYEEQDYELEDKLENYFDSIGRVWEDYEAIYIQEEKMYVKAYYI